MREDIDFYFFMKEDGLKKYGFDLARNILPNWEIHTEYVFTKEVNIDRLSSGFAIESTIDDTHDYLFGTRILFETNTTLIIEYLHNDAGLNTEQMKSFFDAVESAISDNPDLLPVIKQYQSESFGSQFLMKDYLYAKVSQPEPFGWLYSSIGAFVICNLNDNSLSLSAQLSYRPFTNFEVFLWPTVLIGDDNSEYGSRQSEGKIEIWLRWFF